jgi:ribonuclease BN (tRNA processing enzyme)
MSDSIRITVFGSAAGFPTEKRYNTSIGIWRGSDLYLVDSGEPTAAYLARHGATPNALCAVFITHPHVDHCGGLPMLVQWHQLNQRTRPLMVCLPREMITALSDFLDSLYLLPSMLGFDLELRPVDPGRAYETPGFTVDAIPNRHMEWLAEQARAQGYPAVGDSFSYRITVDGKRLLFSGDLRDPGEIAGAAKGVDLAVIEAAHFTPEELGAALAATDVPRVIATHIIHTLEPVEEGVADRVRAAGYRGEISVARDGDEFEV